MSALATNWKTHRTLLLTALVILVGVMVLAPDMPEELHFTIGAGPANPFVGRVAIGYGAVGIVVSTLVLLFARRVDEHTSPRREILGRAVRFWLVMSCIFLGTSTHHFWLHRNDPPPPCNCTEGCPHGAIE